MLRITMPRKTTRSTKRKAAVGISDKQKLAAIAAKTEEETFEDLINDFGIQADKLKRQTKRLFANETKKMLHYLPQKTSIPKEILKMSAYEFKERGGTFAAVMESWKRGDQPAEAAPKPASDKENKDGPGTIDPAFVTPALTNRGKAMIAEASTTKRKPKPLERVALSVHAADSGSPVDENIFMKAKLGQAVEDIESQLLAATASFPQKWRSQLQKQLKHVRVQVTTDMEGQCFQTPALPR